MIIPNILWKNKNHVPNHQPDSNHGLCHVPNHQPIPRFFATSSRAGQVTIATASNPNLLMALFVAALIARSFGVTSHLWHRQGWQGWMKVQYLGSPWISYESDMKLHQHRPQTAATHVSTKVMCNSKFMELSGTLLSSVLLLHYFNRTNTRQ